MLPRNMSEDQFALVTGGDIEHAPLADVLLHLVDENNESAPISDQSDGLQSVALLTLLSLANSQHGLTAIDEPELHLHPAAQAALGHALARSGRQHIIATHSGRVAAAFDPADVVCLSKSRDPRQLSLQSRVTSEIFLWRWWNSELIETLTSERLLFVEGASDRIIIQAVANALGIRLPQLGVHVVELEGAATFARTIRVIGTEGYGIPNCGFCDADAQTEWASALDVSVADLGDIGYVVFDPDLEAEVVGSLGVTRFLELVLEAPYVRKRSILNACGRSQVSDLEELEVMKYWRKGRNKIPLAAALAARMTHADALSIASIVALLETIRDG